jgi:methionyl-tRNA formyltransferase
MNASPLRLVFAGTPEFAAQHLKALLDPALEGKLDVVGVYTQPDRPSGRGKLLTASPVKLLALSHELPVFQPKSLKTPDAYSDLQALYPDVIVVVAYGLMLPPEVLNLPKLGCLNVHASLLPRWRGAAPIERALLAGDVETGIAIMQMDVGLDTGPVHCIRSTPITADDNSETLTGRLVTLGCDALVEILLNRNNTAAPVPQNNNEATYAAKLGREEAAVNWNQGAALVARQIQAFYPRSPAYTYMGKERIMLLEAHTVSAAPGNDAGVIVSADNTGLCVACGEGAVTVSRVQLAGKKPVSVKDLLNGKRESYRPGARFTAGPT